MTNPICRPFCQNVENCKGTNPAYHCRPCGYLKSSAVQSGRLNLPKPVRTHCAKPDACIASRAKHHCHPCAKKKLFAERPQVLAKHVETSRARIVALNADPAHQAKAKAGKQGIFSRRHGVPQEMLPIVRLIAQKMKSSRAEAAAIVRRDLVKGA